MPSSIVPKVEGSNADNAGPEILENGVLSLEPSEAAASKLKVVIQPLCGFCPPESPVRWRLASQGWPRRDLAPLSLHYVSSEADDILESTVTQDSIKVAVWRTLSNLLATKGCTLPEALPRITFDEVKAKGNRALGVIDIVFSSSDAFEVARKNLRQISVGGVGSQRRVYLYERFSNAVPQDVMAFDCLGLPLQSLNIEALFASVTAMTAELGSLIGIGKTVTISKDFSPESWSGLLRFYLKLDRRWMAAPERDIALQLPTHLKWYGSLYKLFYLGYKHHSEESHSLDYPLQSVEEAAGASTTTSASQTNGSGHESTEASQKRKTREE